VVVGVQDVPQLALAVLLTGRPQRAVAEERAGRLGLDDEREGVAVRGDAGGGELERERVADLVLAARAPVEEPGRVGARLQRQQGVEVVLGVGPQAQALGLQREGRRERERHEHLREVRAPAQRAPHAGRPEAERRVERLGGGRAIGHRQLDAGVARRARPGHDGLDQPPAHAAAAGRRVHPGAPQPGGRRGVGLHEGARHAEPLPVRLGDDDALAALLPQRRRVGGLELGVRSERVWRVAQGAQAQLGEARSLPRLHSPHLHGASVTRGLGRC